MNYEVADCVKKAFALAERLVAAVERIAVSVEAIENDVAALAGVVTEVEDHNGRPLGTALMTTQP